MSEIEILSQILNLGDEWHLQSAEVDQLSNRLDITIGFGPAKKKSFFSRGKTDSDVQTIALRHLPVLGMRTFLHVPEAGSVDSHKVWNPMGSKLTCEMEKFLIEVLNNTHSNQAASQISGITPAEVRKVSERTGAGTNNSTDTLSNLASTATSRSDSFANYGKTKSFELTEHSDIPPETDENWQGLIDGTIPIQTNAVGLQMLLQRIRQDIANKPSEISRLNSAKLLRQYFIKNQKQHQADIVAISGNTEQIDPREITSSHPIGQTGSFPADNHVVWQKIIDGDLKIHTSNVALQMMLEGVRQSVERNPTEASHRSMAKTLRQFFIKYEDRLTDEARQMGISLSSPASVAASDVSIPTENETCWQQLISGALKIQTNAVGLQMMMERVRQSVEKNNSDANRMAGIKILRQYFIKHHAAAQNEILQLNSMGGTIPTTAAVSESATVIPAESHSSWQRLIDGDLVLDTDIVALKMMLQSVRISIEKNPTESSRHAGAKILRQYFIKHQNKHKAELNQLIAA